jgi:uncharacterized protein
VLLAEKGLEHEQEILTRFRNVVHNQSNDNIEAFKYCIRSMEKGCENLAGFPLFTVQEGYEGHVDLLRRDDSHQSYFGNYCYEVIEIKLAKRIQPKHAFQAAYYNELLGKIQGYFPEFFFVINGEGKEMSFNFETHREELYSIIEEINNIWKGEIIPEPGYNDVDYHWSGYANQLAREREDVSLINGIGGKTREKLLEKNLKTVSDVSNASIDVLTQVKGIARKKAVTFKTRAQALTSSQILSLANGKLRLTIPSADVELYIDYEGIDPTTNPRTMEAFDFIYGVITKKNTDTYYNSFVIHDPYNDEEIREVFQSFLEYLESYPTSPIFHWYHYEPTRTLKTLVETGLSLEYKKIFSRFYDLSKPANKNWVFPTYSMSLKDLARLLGFDWRIQDFDGKGAITTYIEYISSFIKDDDLINRVCLYNEDDIKALIILKEWMEENS